MAVFVRGVSYDIMAQYMTKKADWRLGRFTGKGLIYFDFLANFLGHVKCMTEKPASIAQLVEQRICNAQVAGSSPAAGSNDFEATGLI